jgi:conjugal transfer pilus assembly protein TraW
MNKELLLLVIFCCFGNLAIAKDFGKQGASFEIKEEGLQAMIKRKLADLNLQEHYQKMQDLAKKRIEEPKAIENITRASKTITYNFDPSYVLDIDVYLPSGKLLYPIGTTVNPLDHLDWDDRLIFLDGTDQQQLAWVTKNYLNSKEVSEEGSPDNKIVLVAGKPLELEQKIEHPVYFDQFGALTKKFNIAHVPAIIEQDGKYLKVTEVNIEGKY